MPGQLLSSELQGIPNDAENMSRTSRVEVFFEHQNLPTSVKRDFPFPEQIAANLGGDLAVKRGTSFGP